mgnify:CR=1 FL=1
MEVNQDNNSNEEVTINYKIKIHQVLGKIFYDRDSVVFRGPFVFQQLNRGPELIFKIKDLGYPQEYNFSLPVKKLKTEKLYKIL